MALKTVSYLRKLLLRSWVQLPPGPFLPVVQILYYFEFDFGYCPTNSAAMHCCSPTTIVTFFHVHPLVVILVIVVIPLFAA
jgi:hypothetical protein